jgi:hypothetical protein
MKLIILMLEENDSSKNFFPAPSSFQPQEFLPCSIILPTPKFEQRVTAERRLGGLWTMVEAASRPASVGLGLGGRGRE